jgi:hypothetical protein
MKRKLIVIDDFFDNPDDVREFALSCEYKSDNNYYKGLRSVENYHFPNAKELFESLLGERIDSFPNEGSVNGCFQITTAEDFQVYHCDSQKWAAIIYLTPDAPFHSGTRTHASKINGAKHGDDYNIDESFTGGFYDSTKFDIVDSIGNVYNRMILMDAKQIHSAGNYFGNSKETGRLVQIFFFG